MSINNFIKNIIKNSYLSGLIYLILILLLIPIKNFIVFDLSPLIKTEVKSNKGKKIMATLLHLSSEYLLNK